MVSVVDRCCKERLEAVFAGDVDIEIVDPRDVEVAIVDARVV